MLGEGEREDGAWLRDAQPGHHLLDDGALGGEPGQLKVAQDHPDRAVVGIAVHFDGMDETIASGGAFGGNLGGQRGEEVAGEAQRVDHDALGPAGMNGDAADLQHGGVGGKRFVIDLTKILAIERVADVGGEFLQIKFGHAARDLLVRVEAHADDAVRDVGMTQQVAHRVHDDGDARLVVGAKEGRAARGDEVVSDLFPQMRDRVDSELLRGVVRQYDRLAVVLAMDDRLGAAGQFGGRVDVRKPGEAGHAGLGRGGRDRGERIAVGGEPDVGKTELLQFLLEQTQQVPLSRRTRAGGRVGVAPGVDADVAAEAFEQVFGVDGIIHASIPSHDRRHGAKQKTDFVPTLATAKTAGRFCRARSLASSEGTMLLSILRKQG